MANDFLSQVLGSVLGGGASQSGQGGLGGLGSLGGLGGLGGMLGGMLGGGQRASNDDDGSPLAGKGALLAALLPLALQLVQRAGGIGGLMEKFKQAGHGQQVGSWVSTGENQPIDAGAVQHVFGDDELSQMSQQLGVPQEEVAGGLAQILPQIVNHLSPEGEVHAGADDTLNQALSQLSQAFGR